MGLNQHLDWPGVKQVCQIHRERTLNGKTSVETAYFVTSLSRERADAEALLQLPRQHWAVIENGLHYVRDETMGEDRCTICTGHAPQNLAALRNTALNFLRLLGVTEFAKTMRGFARQPQRLFSYFGYLE